MITVKEVKQIIKEVTDNDSRMVVDSDGAKSWFNKNDKLHRTDGPAAEYADGTITWYKNGKLHRLDEPAAEDTDGTQEWETSPEDTDGTITWYKNDKRIKKSDSV